MSIFNNHLNRLKNLILWFGAAFSGSFMAGMVDEGEIKKLGPGRISTPRLSEHSASTLESELGYY